MKISSSAILLLICGSWAKSLPKTKAYKDFKRMCDVGQTINGMIVSVHGGGAKGNDLLIQFTCRTIDPNGNLKIGQCSDKEEFVLFKGKEIGENLVGCPSNCAEGEYLAGVNSTYVKGDSKGEHMRKMTFHCCAPENAKVNYKIGCHCTETMDPFKTARPGDLMLKNKYFVKRTCPRDALSAVEVSDWGITFKYCPYKVKGQSYNAKCETMKKRDDLLKMVEELPVVKIGEWTEFGKDFNMECPNGEVVSSIDVKLDNVTRDVAMKCTCKPAQEEFENKNTITRITEMSYMELVSGFGDCDNKKEMVAGIVSQMDYSMRMMGLKCVRQSNTVVKVGTVPETPDVNKTVTTEGVTIQPSQSGLKLIDFYIQRVPKIVAHARFSAVRGIEKAQFEKTKEINQANKQIKIINDGMGMDYY